MHCPRCGMELTIFEEHRGTKWLYRQYPCPRCRVVWDWASKIRYHLPEQNYWKLEECKAWKAVGLPIIEEHRKKYSHQNT